MSTGNSPSDDADLEDFLERQSTVSTAYDNLELVEPTAELDARILAAARAVVAPVESPEPASPGAAAPATPLVWSPPPRPPEPQDDEDDDDDEEDTPPVRRPRWVMPAALAASVLAAVGIGFSVLDVSPSVQEGKSGLGAMFAKRARERSAADKAQSEAYAAAAQELEVMVMPAPPPPPSLQPESPQVADLDSSIALIRRELVLINQTDASADVLPIDTLAERAASSLVDAPAASPASAIQSRNRRLAKIVELHDDGNPDLARDALEIFLRDFADDPISQRILGGTP